MKISIRKKHLISLGFLMSAALVANPSCEQKQIVISPTSTLQENSMLKVSPLSLEDQPSVSLVQEEMIDANMDVSIVDAFCELVADLFEGKNASNINKSITDLIQEALDLIATHRTTFNNFKTKEKIDKIVVVFKKIKEGIRSGYFYNDSRWCGKLPGPRLQEMANLLKEFVDDLPAVTRKRLTVGKLQQLAMLQVLIKRLALEKVTR